MRDRLSVVIFQKTRNRQSPDIYIETENRQPITSNKFLSRFCKSLLICTWCRSEADEGNCYIPKSPFLFCC
jgi:hypothetical protein